MWASGVHITVQMSTPYYSIKTIGGPNLTFEYSNLVSTSGSVPEPATFALLGIGMSALALASVRHRKGTRGHRESTRGHVMQNGRSVKVDPMEAQ